MDNVTETAALPEGVSGYRLYHGYVSLVVCSLGIGLNILNAFIWSRKCMRSSTNLILTMLAITDCLCLFFYLIYSSYLFIATGPSQLLYHPKVWMFVVVITFHEFIAFHTTSNWLTISLAIFRYIKVCHPNAAKVWCNKRRAKLTVVIVFVTTAMATIPFYFYYEVYNVSEDYPTLTGYWIRKTNFARNNIDYQTILLWLYGVIFKVCPSIAMIILSALMIRKLHKAQKRQRVFTVGRESHVSNHRGYCRTTVMLIVILMIYVLMELPIGISAFTSGLQGGESHFFYFLLYSEVGDILDMLTLLNASVNFAVYFALSHQFRTVLKGIVLRKSVSEVHFGSDSTEMSGSRTASVYTVPVIWKSIKQKLHL
ncbi:sex peptide receptor-like [Saccostrea echinata]|uniref:sex peptide receptor-like n=1 Tax=Saccostrea echinata TaxID=191078 RepID=UPI002A7F7828|nr:sex peptide receptor-like [Saccostrea echinata]